MKFLSLMVITFTFTMAGCAGYNVREGGTGAGFDVYRPEPYLLITPEKAVVVWLPNFEKKYRIDTWAGLGKADFEFEIENGWLLTKVSDKTDNSALLDLPGKLKDLLPSAKTTEDTLATAMQFTLYKIVVPGLNSPLGLQKVDHLAIGPQAKEASKKADEPTTTEGQQKP